MYEYSEEKKKKAYFRRTCFIGEQLPKNWSSIPAICIGMEQDG